MLVGGEIHAGTPRTHERRSVPCPERLALLIDEITVTIVHLDTAETLSTHNIDTERSYWRNTQKVQGRWPGTF